MKVKLTKFPVGHVTKKRIQGIFPTFGLRNWRTWLPLTRWKKVMGNGFKEKGQGLGFGRVKFKGPVGQPSRGSR